MTDPTPGANALVAIEAEDRKAAQAALDELSRSELFKLGLDAWTLVEMCQRTRSHKRLEETR